MKKSPQLLSTLLLLGFSLFSVRAADLCSGVSPSRLDITIGSPATSVTQTDCVQSFQVTPTLNNYLMLEITFQNSPTDPSSFLPFLVADPLPALPPGSLNPVRPTVSLSDAGKLKANSLYSDSNGLINRKSYHYILLTPQQVGTQTNIVFSMFKAYTDSAHPYTGNFVYTVRARASPTYICPQGCSNNNGVCDTDKKKCMCNKGFFDEDCSVSANEIILGSLNKKTIDPYAWGYFYFNIGDFDEAIKISLIKDNGAMKFSFMINEKDDFTIPNTDVSIGIYQLASAEPQGYLLIQEDNVSTRKNDVILVGAYNDKAASTAAQVLLESYDDSSVLRTVSIYLMLGISFALLTVWVAISAFRYKHHTQMESLIRVYQTEREEDKTLTKKDINKYFPKEKFKDLKTSFCQTMCSVCLEDFEPETVCRQLYCEHIYHGNCIEAWLAQHYNCPNCKKDITKVAIEEHLKEKASKEEKSILAHEKIVEKKDHSGNANHSEAESSGVGIVPQRVQIKRPNREIIMEETKENNDLAFENLDPSHRNKHRNLTNTNPIQIENRRIEANLQLTPSHEDGKTRNLGRSAVSRDLSNVQEPAPRTEINSRAQNIRRGNRGAHGTIIQQNSEAEANAFRLEL